MMETREIRTQWQTYRQALLRADYNQADEELARVLFFAAKNPIVAGIVTRLQASQAYREFSVDAWVSGRGAASVSGTGRTNLRLSLDDEERAAQCLGILEWAVEQY